jgi:DNA polymerase-1
MIDFGKRLKIHAVRQKGYQLLHDGLVELSRVEANGIRIDVTRLAETKVDLQNRIRVLKTEMEEEKVFKLWRKRYGAKTNLTSRNQLASILYEEMGHEVTATTEGGRAAMDEEALQKIDDPFVAKMVQFLKYEKTLGTFLKGIEKEVVGDRIHPCFNLHVARTYRSSSDSPNFQNFPVRDKEISELVRSHFIASPGCVLVENDFKGIEVSVSACYHKDSNFISYITTPGKDMHRDMAAQIYLLETAEVDKDIRYGAKNKFVFPQFYGDFYVACARNLWDWVRQGKLKGPDGKSLYKHLKNKGITGLGKCDPEEEPVEGTFEAHLKEVEDDFWNRRFMQYGQWRREWYQSYLKRGYFDLFTGFRVHGSFNRNSVVNYPVQGSAFHCLLWALIQVNKVLVKHQMKSKIVGQIHDSLIGDVRIDELKDYLEIVEQVTTVDLRKHYDWLIVPLEIEYEIAPPEGNWFQKREVKFKKGKFYHPEKPDKFTSDPVKFTQMLKNL